MEAETPLLEHMATPFTLPEPPHTERTLLLDEKSGFPMPPWTAARRDTHGRRFPQTIAHRGYKAQYPENTMEAFRGAVTVGAHAIETDIHLSKDGVVVLSHDATLKRCFGEDKKIIDCTWEYLSKQRTIKAPHESMPRLKDLLEYVASPGLEDIWIMLDIKLDNDAENVMRLIGETVKSTTPGRKAWQHRVILGCWAARFLPLCFRYLPNHPICHIGFNTSDARNYLKVPNVSFNMLQISLYGPGGSRFMEDVKAAGRHLFAWTVNEKNLMTWCVQKDLDGVITDDPKMFLEVCEQWDDDEKVARLTWFQWLYSFWIALLVTYFSFSFRRRFPFEGVEEFVAPKEATSGRRAMKQ